MPTDNNRICGFTIAEIDAATCYLTYKGMVKLRPCAWARDWMFSHGRVEVTAELFKAWSVQAPKCWLMPACVFLSYDGTPTYGPKEDWPWGRVSVLERDELLSHCNPARSNRLMARYLKAFIMLKGRRS